MDNSVKRYTKATLTGVSGYYCLYNGVGDTSTMIVGNYMGGIQFYNGTQVDLSQVTGEMMLRTQYSGDLKIKFT